MSVHIFSPIGCVHSANFVGATTVPTNVPSGPGWIATLPPLNNQTPSIGEVALAEAIRSQAPRSSSSVIIAANSASSSDRDTLEDLIQSFPSVGGSPRVLCQSENTSP